jgi:hypothetical protein
MPSRVFSIPVTAPSGVGFAGMETSVMGSENRDRARGKKSVVRVGFIAGRYPTSTQGPDCGAFTIAVMRAPVPGLLPGLFRASQSLRLSQDVDGRAKPPAMTIEGLLQKTCCVNDLPLLRSRGRAPTSALHRPPNGLCT